MSVKTVDATEPEIHLHADWMAYLGHNKVKFKAWGSAGPDLLIAGNGAILEVKKEEAASLVKAAYDEIFKRVGHKNPSFDPVNAAFVGIITPEKVRIWRRTASGYGPLSSPDMEFVVASEKAAVLSLIKSKDPNPRLALDDHLDTVLRVIYSKACPDQSAALRTVLNLDLAPVMPTNRAIFFAPGTANEKEVEVAGKDAKDFLVTEIINKYYVRDMAAVKHHIRHKWSQYQPDGKKAGLGKYYTPEHLVVAVSDLLAPVLAKHGQTGYVADLAAGCGAFLAAFEDYNIIGRDIDDQAVMVLTEMGFNNIKVANSLHGVSRTALGLADEDELIVVGNPPYNDMSSLNKRYSTDKKEAAAIAIDDDIRSRDLGISFLRAFAKLKANAICVLHPLSYLTKETNFRALGDFTNKYKLDAAFVFSSGEFGAAIGAKTPFPIVAALYVPGSMTYADITDFKFELRASDHAGLFGPTCSKLQLASVTTIDGLIRKYPPTAGMDSVSDIGVYQYNIRDANSLITSGALTTHTDANRIPVQFKNLASYAYLNVFKRYFGTDFVFGNLSPICNPQDLANELFQDACILDTIMNNPSIKATSPGNRDSFVITKHVINRARREAKAFSFTDMPNFYQAFVDYWTAGAAEQKVLKVWFENYFKNLRGSMLV